MDNYCKTCCHDDGDIGFCDKCYYNHILEGKGIPPTEYEAKTKPITNADHIRSMTDEELADWFYRIQYDVSDYYCGGHSCEPTLPTGKESWIAWLRQRVNDGR